MLGVRGVETLANLSLAFIAISYAIGSWYCR